MYICVELIHVFSCAWEAGEGEQGVDAPASIESWMARAIFRDMLKFGWQGCRGQPDFLNCCSLVFPANTVKISSANRPVLEALSGSKQECVPIIRERNIASSASSEIIKA